MRNLSRLGGVALLVMLVLVLSQEVARAQDPAKVAPKTHKVLLENDQVRVLDIRVAPGQKVPMHSHPGYVVYALTPYKVKFTSPDGKSAIVEGKAGEATWRDAETHAPENVGTKELHVLNIELKASH